MKKIICLELNELNFDFIKNYIDKGYLPNFKYILDKYGLTVTKSEKKYKELEPWIQWVTVHTGKTYQEHGIFRLGDAADKGVRQIWEDLEAKFDISVAAISPMNAKDQTKKAGFFVPDPWSANSVTGSRDLKYIYDAAHQAVNDNSSSKIELKSIAKLLYGIMFNLRAKSIKTYLNLIKKIKNRKWYKALFLDRLLADVFITQWNKAKPDYSSLFLNAAAHIQHHYMFNSLAYDGKLKNPSWYVEKGVDPVLDCYQMYDELIGDFLGLVEKENVRLLIVTALSQRPNARLVFYYRPINHESFMKLIGVDYHKVSPRMSRDFLLRYNNEGDALKAQNKLETFTLNDCPLFSVDNRGDTLFCQVCYTDEIVKDDKIILYTGEELQLLKHLIHVSVENGIHRTEGYLLDSANSVDSADEQILLTDVYSKITQHYAEEKVN